MTDDEDECKQFERQYKNIISRSYDGNSGIDMHTFDLQLDIIRTMEERDETESEDCIEALEWYDGQEDNILRAIADIDAIIYHAQHVPTQYIAAYESLEAENLTLAQIASPLLTGEVSDPDQLQELQQRVSQFHNSVSAYEMNVRNYKQQQGQLVSDLLSQIETTSDKIYYLKEYYRISAVLLSTSLTDLSKSDKRMLRDISKLCIQDYGRMVTSVQSLLSAKLDIDQKEALCEEDEINERSRDESRMSIHPNPSTGQFVVTLPEDYLFENAILRVADFTGKAVHGQLAKQSNIIQLEDVVPGVYFIQITQEDQILEIKKVILIN